MSIQTKRQRRLLRASAFQSRSERRQHLWPDVIKPGPAYLLIHSCHEMHHASHGKDDTCAKALLPRGPSNDVEQIV